MFGVLKCHVEVLKCHVEVLKCHVGVLRCHAKFCHHVDMGFLQHLFLMIVFPPAPSRQTQSAAWTSTVAIIPTQYHEPPPNARPMRCPTNNAKRAKHSKILKPGCFFVFTPFYQWTNSVLCVVVVVESMVSLIIESTSDVGGRGTSVF